MTPASRAGCEHTSIREEYTAPHPAEVIALDLVGVTKTFGRDEQMVRALGPLDLKVEAGTFVSVVGPSGCGKTTLAAAYRRS
jgi:NitT/TauT family transport system ATP-binding protein